MTGPSLGQRAVHALDLARNSARAVGTAVLWEHRVVQVSSGPRLLTVRYMGRHAHASDALRALLGPASSEAVVLRQRVDLPCAMWSELLWCSPSLSAPPRVEDVLIRDPWLRLLAPGAHLREWELPGLEGYTVYIGGDARSGAEIPSCVESLRGVRVPADV